MSRAIHDFIIVEKNLELIKRFERLKELGLYSPRSKNLVYANSRDGFKPSKELKALWDKMEEWRENGNRNTGKVIEKNGIQTIWMRIPKE